MAVYYNEHDPKAAAWLKELLKVGLIADGEIDTRSILDVRPADLAGFDQCHFFAGIGGWSYALRLAGWADDRAVWTGSCPCQPFSAAGKGDGFADERHLWPAFYWLIAERAPHLLFGEQVESPAGRAWLDLVSTDLEAADYAIGPSDLPAAGIGSPQIRQRLFWVADRESDRCRQGHQDARALGGDEGNRAGLGIVRCANGLDDSGHAERGPGHRSRRRMAREHAVLQGEETPSLARQSVEAIRLVNGLIARLEGHGGDGHDRIESRRLDPDAARSVAETGATRGAWGVADWLYCRDETIRPVEPGTFPLAHGLPARVGRLRGYGNAIVPQLAAEFIGAYAEVRELSI